MQNYGLGNKYIDDINFAFELRKLIALAFIPVNKVVNVFETLLDTDFYTENEEVLSSLITYFEGTWIGILDRRGKRRSPMYQIENWNCLDRLQNDLPRSNNNIEAEADRQIFFYWENFE